MDVYLDPLEMEIARRVALLRDEKMADIADKFDSEALPDRRLYGVWGEMVFAKLHNVNFYPDENALPWDVMYNGWMIDVKCSEHPNLAINADLIKDGVDAYVNVQHVKDNQFRYTGAITKRRLLRDYTPQPNTHADCYLVPADELTMDIPKRK